MSSEEPRHLPRYQPTSTSGSMSQPSFSRSSSRADTLASHLADLNLSESSSGPRWSIETDPEALALEIIIIGGGISGLACAFALTHAGHCCIVLEASSPPPSSLEEPLETTVLTGGGGMHMPPNLCKLLYQWGFGPEVQQYAFPTEGMRFVDYKTDEQLGYMRWMEEVLNAFGADYPVITRAALHKMFLDACLEIGVTIQYSSQVKEITVPDESDDDTPPSTPSTTSASSQAFVTLSNGEIIAGDLIIGADGHGSQTREFVNASHVRRGKTTRKRSDTITPRLYYGNGNSRINGYTNGYTNGHINGHSDSYSSSDYGYTSDESEDSDSSGHDARLRDSHTLKNGRLIYSTLIPASSLLSDPDLKTLWEYKGPTIWMGSERHAEGYPIPSQNVYALHILNIDNHPTRRPHHWRQVDRPMQTENLLIENVRGCNPTLRKLISLMPSAIRTKDGALPMAEKWIDASGHVVLVGDAAHPIVPCVFQGAAMAVEDAACLGTLLAHLDTPSYLSTLLRAYYDLRSERCLNVYINEHRTVGNFWLIEGSPAQIHRDDYMRRAEASGDLSFEEEGVPKEQWEMCKEAYSYDAGEEAEEWYARWGVLHDQAAANDVQEGKVGFFGLTMAVQVQVDESC